jgi:hypothetical protein
MWENVREQWRERVKQNQVELECLHDVELALENVLVLERVHDFVLIDARCIVQA